MLSGSEILPYQFLKQYTSIFVDENGCWLSKRKVDKNVYQKIKFNGRRVPAHILSNSLFNDFNKESKLLTCHRCDTPACFNPFHLFTGTHFDNMQDAINKRRLGRKLAIEELQTEVKNIIGNLYEEDVFNLEDLTTEDWN